MTTPPGQIITIETIMEALKALLLPLLTNGSGFKVVTRRFKTPDQISDLTQTPGLYILQGPISSVRVGGVPAKQTINVWLFIYTNPEPVDILASTTLNNAVSAVNAIMADPIFPLREQTLGGLVSNCWIEGETIYDSGEVQPPGMAIIPVKILVPTLAI